MISSFAILQFLVAALIGAGGVYLVAGPRVKSREADILAEAAKMLEKEREEAKRIRQDAKHRLEEVKLQAQEENALMATRLERVEEGIVLKEKNVNDRLSRNGNLEKEVKDLKTAAKETKAEMNRLEMDFIEKLLTDCKLTREQVVEMQKNELTQGIEARRERFVKNRIEEVEEDNVKLAQDILVGALQRYAGGSSVDHASSLVEVRSEPFKAALVGKHGENIACLEEKFEEIDFIFNDLPKTITLAGGKLLTRQVARQTIELLQKNRIEVTPKNIIGLIDEAEKKVERIMKENAANATKIIGIKNAPDDILKHIGRLHFRTSYGQNALRHCIEVGMFAGLIASEVGANVEVARIAGFFHDIGKSLSEESDKGHDFITKDILEANNYPEEIIHAAWVHHEAEPAKTLEAKIVMAADALSASRPGARLESLDRYLERIRALEATAGSFPGIKKTFAISAGREVRVLVYPDQVTDEALNELAQSIAGKIEHDLTYPGNIKVNVIRRQHWESTASTHERPQ